MHHHSSLRPATWLLAVLCATALALGGQVAVAPSASAEAPATDKECLEADLVWVVVDNGTDDPTGSCAEDFGTGLEALDSAGVDYYDEGGFVCQFDNYPAPVDGNRCDYSKGYWSYWQLNSGDDGTFDGSTWSYSQLGAGSSKPLKRSVEGWRYVLYEEGSPTPDYTAPDLEPIEPPDPGDTVTIPDAGLRGCIADELGVPSSRPLTAAQLAGISELECFYAGISDLTGAEHLTGATSLSFQLNDIADLEPLAGLADLESLDLDGNEVTDLADLSDLTGLSTLVIDGNPLTDTSGLSALTGLTRLEASKAGLTDLSDLATLTSLRHLDVSSNGLTSLAGVEDLTGLTELLVYGNPVTDLSPVAGLTSLTLLNAHTTGTTSVAPLSGLTKLTNVNLRSNDITDVQALSSLTGLRVLTLGTNPVTDITPLTSLTGLEELDLQKTKVADLAPLTGMSSLAKLYLHDAAVADLSPTSALPLTSWGALKQVVTAPTAHVGEETRLPKVLDRDGKELELTGSVPVEDGTVTYDAVGTYSFTFSDAARKFTGTLTQEVTEAPVEPTPTTITSEDVETTHAKGDKISASVPGARGRVTLTLGGTTRSGWVKDGRVSFVVPRDLTARIYTARWNSVGNADFAPSTVASRVTIRSAPTTPSVTYPTAPRSDATGSAQLRVVGPSGAPHPKGKVTLTLSRADGRKVVLTRTLAWGRTTPTVPKLATGTWKAVVSYTGEPTRYLRSSHTGSVRVTR